MILILRQNSFFNMANETFFLKDKAFYLFNTKFENLIVGFTTRNGGVSQGNYFSFNLGLHNGDSQESVIKNREILAQKFNKRPEDFVFMNQTHSTNIVFLDKNDNYKNCGFYNESSALQDTDAVFTNDMTKILCVMTADCAPLLFYEPLSKIIGAAHCGWRGVVNGIISKTFEKCLEKILDFDLKNVRVFIGPNICGNCYEVGKDFVELLNKQYSNYISFIFEKNGKFYFDLEKAIINDLKFLGVQRKKIFNCKLCTFENTSQFYSYRFNNQTGRMINFIFCN